jgi:hypothetical protein
MRLNSISLDERHPYPGHAKTAQLYSRIIRFTASTVEIAYICTVQNISEYEKDLQVGFKAALSYGSFKLPSWLIWVVISWFNEKDDRVGPRRLYHYCA